MGTSSRGIVPFVSTRAAVVGARALMAAVGALLGPLVVTVWPARPETALWAIVAASTPAWAWLAGATLADGARPPTDAGWSVFWRTLIAGALNGLACLAAMGVYAATGDGPWPDASALGGMVCAGAVVAVFYGLGAAVPFALAFWVWARRAHAVAHRGSLVERYGLATRGAAALALAAFVGARSYQVPAARWLSVAALAAAAVVAGVAAWRALALRAFARRVAGGGAAWLRFAPRPPGADAPALAAEPGDDVALLRDPPPVAGVPFRDADAASEVVALAPGGAVAVARAATRAALAALAVLGEVALAAAWLHHAWGTYLVEGGWMGGWD